MSVLQRRIAAKWPWPDGLRPKIAPYGVARLDPGWPGPAPRALSGTILGCNAGPRQTATRP